MSSKDKLILDLQIKQQTLEDDLFEIVRKQLVLRQASAICRNYQFDHVLEPKCWAFEGYRDKKIVNAFKKFFVDYDDLNKRIGDLQEETLGYIGLNQDQEVSCNTVYLPKVVSELPVEKKKENAKFIVLLFYSKKAYMYYFREKTQSFENPQPLNFEDMCIACGARMDFSYDHGDKK